MDAEKAKEWEWWLAEYHRVCVERGVQPVQAYAEEGFRRWYSPAATATATLTGVWPAK